MKEFFSRIKNTVAFKLVIWLFIVSLFSMVVIIFYVRGNFTEQLLNFQGQNFYHDIREVKNGISSLDNFGMSRFFQQEELSHNQQYFVIDKNGKFILGAENLDKFYEKLPLVITQELLNGKEGVVINEDQKLVFVYEEIPERNYILIASLDASTYIVFVDSIELGIFFRLGWLLLFISFVGGVIMFLTISPLQKLIKIIHKVKSGNLDIKISPDEFEGEIETLAVEFGYMISDLKKSRKELEDFNINLEKKVDERTRELALKNKELEQINKFMINRELKMIELKHEIQELKKESEGK